MVAPTPDSRRPQSSDGQGRGGRSARSHSARGHSRPLAVELVRGFEPVAEPTTVATSSKGDDQQLEDTLVHGRCLDSLSALKHLEVELDLNFQSAREPARLGSGDCTLDLACGEAEDCDEVELQLQLVGPARGSSGRGGGVGSGRAQGVLVRARRPWELRTTGDLCARAGGPPSALPPTPRAFSEPHHSASSRPSVSGAWISRRPVGSSLPHGRPPPQPAEADLQCAAGDRAQGLRLDLCDQRPEGVVLRRRRGGRRASMRQRAASPEPTGAGAAEWVADVQERCLRLERNVCRRRPPAQAVRPGAQGQAVAEDTDGPAGGSEAPAAPRVSPAASAGGSVQECLRDLRAVLRLLAPGLPAASRLLEGAVKGMLLSLDSDLGAARARAASLESSAAVGDEKQQELMSLKEEVDKLRLSQKEAQRKLDKATRDKNDEIDKLLAKASALRAEVERLAPDPTTLDAVAALLGEMSTLMLDMEGETRHQDRILKDMSQYTAKVIGKAAGEDGERVSHGRVVQLNTGEILLRPCGVREVEVQVSEHMLRQAVEAGSPVVLRPPHMRQLLCRLEACGEDVPRMTTDDLGADIDRIYMAKMAADSECDACGVARSALSSFVTEFYLEQLGDARLAEVRLASMVNCLYNLRRSTLHPKLSLFARFLEFCEFERALPLPALNVALAAKRLAQAAAAGRSQSGSSPRPSSPSRAGTVGSSGLSSLDMLAGRPKVAGKPSAVGSRLVGKKSMYEQEASAGATLPLALAYEAVARALNRAFEPALRAVFVTLAASMDVSGGQQPTGMLESPQLLALVLILHHKLQRDQAPKLRDLVASSKPNTAEGFQEALDDAQVLGVDASVWRPGLCVGSSQLSAEVLGELFGGGAAARLPTALVSEATLMEAAVAGQHAGFLARSAQLQRFWERQAKGGVGALAYVDVKSALQSAEPTIPQSLIRALFMSAVEASRSCTQLEGAMCPVLGTLEPDAACSHGGEVVTLQLLRYAALKHSIFLQDPPSSRKKNSLASPSSQSKNM